MNKKMRNEPILGTVLTLKFSIVLPEACNA